MTHQVHTLAARGLRAPDCAEAATPRALPVAGGAALPAAHSHRLLRLHRRAGARCAQHQPHQWDLLTPPKWIGLGNYQPCSSRCPSSGRRWATPSTTRCSTFRGVFLPLLVAIFMNQKCAGDQHLPQRLLPARGHLDRGRGAGLVVALQPRVRPVNYLLDLVGIKGPVWLATTWAMLSIVIMSVWKGRATPW